MLLSQGAAFDILGLPTFATCDDISMRYKALALMWFPEKHSNRTLALQEFSNISEAAVTLIFPQKKRMLRLGLCEMYGFFQYMFFGKGRDEAEELTYDSDNDSECSLAFVDDVATELQAASNAEKLIMEEENEKAKADKRRAKKKRRKERKKLEKLDKETIPVEIKKEAPSTSNTDKNKKIQETKTSESEEDIDESSAFVKEIMKKKKKNKAQVEEKIEEKTHHKQNLNIPPEDPQSVILRSQAIAARGNDLARLGHFSVAAELFTESIKLYPDYRFYGNRSFCYDCLNLNDKALRDAEKAITSNPEWPKGHFRKGRALLGLKRYSEAEVCFIEVLKLDPECVDAVSELHTVGLLQLMEKGYSKEHAQMAIENYGSVQEALKALQHLAISKTVDDHIHTEIFDSDDECDGVWTKNSKPKIAPHLYDIKRDPKNPEGHNSVWVGNVGPSITEKQLVTMFSKFGELISIKVMPEKFCAFINFKNKSSPGKAMQAYQGFDVGGSQLVIRFPNLPGEAHVKKKTKPEKVPVQEAAKVKPQGPVNGNECYFWRTTGCVYAENCRFKHIKDHKGIDKQKWQVTA